MLSWVGRVWGQLVGQLAGRHPGQGAEPIAESVLLLSLSEQSFSSSRPAALLRCGVVGDVQDHRGDQPATGEDSTEADEGIDFDHW